MKSILITGGTGLIGSGLVKSIDKSIYKVYVLTRKKPYVENEVDYINWDNQFLISHILKTYTQLLI